MIRILVVHQTKLICNLFATVLNEEKDINVVDQAHSVADAIIKLKSVRCNIVLVSAQLPDNGALELTKSIAADYPDIKVLVTGVLESKHVILQYVMAGAAGYVLQEVPVDQLFENIRAVHEDKALVTPEIAAALMDHITELAHISSQVGISPDAYDALTPREREVLELIGDDLTNQEIAERLYIEVGTVKNHVHNILKKLDVSSRDEAAAHLPYIEEEEKG